MEKDPRQKNPHLIVGEVLEKLNGVPLGNKVECPGLDSKKVCFDWTSQVLYDCEGCRVRHLLVSHNVRKEAPGKFKAY